VKISWGVGISIIIIVFMLISIGLIYFAFNQDVNLVREDYYEAEINFGKKMETVKRTDQLTEKLEIILMSEYIQLKFPKMLDADKIFGTIFLYRPSNRDMDINLPIQLDSTKMQFINTNNLIKGMWKIQVEWNADTNSFYNDKILMVQ